MQTTTLTKEQAYRNYEEAVEKETREYLEEKNRRERGHLSDRSISAKVRRMHRLGKHQ